MEKIRVAIVGAGNIAQSAHLPAYQKRDDLEVVAIADWNLARAQDAAKKFGGHLRVEPFARRLRHQGSRRGQEHSVRKAHGLQP